jgi:hypothetical protein
VTSLFSKAGLPSQAFFVGYSEEKCKIREELSKYSASIIIEFEKILSPEKCWYEPGTDKGGECGGYNYFIQNIIPKEGSWHSVNLTMLKEDPWNNFWQRWNRFLNLKAFL